MKKLTALIALSTLATPAAYADMTLTPYGFIKASAMYSDKALASYNNINLSAPTFAVAQTRTQDANSRTSFQAAQSRFGATVSKSANITGRFEFDLIDFNKSSPTTQMLPRVRRALVTYKGEGYSLDVGQDWDLFSPTNPYTYDIVGLYFNAGNAGFQRQQIQYHKQAGTWELSGAIGMAGNNPGATDTDLEMANSPSYSLRALRAHDGLKYGVSAIYANLKYQANQSRHDTYGTNAFFEHDTPSFGLKAEVFYGQNLASIGALTLAKGTSTTDVKEYGGYVSANVPVAEKWKVFGGLGLDRIDNKQELSAYSYNTTTNLITANGVRSNFLSRIGTEHIIETDFSWLFEISRYETTSKLGATQYHTYVAHSVESGILWKF